MNLIVIQPILEQWDSPSSFVPIFDMVKFETASCSIFGISVTIFKTNMFMTVFGSFRVVECSLSFRGFSRMRCCCCISSDPISDVYRTDWKFVIAASIDCCVSLFNWKASFVESIGNRVCTIVPLSISVWATTKICRPIISRKVSHCIGKCGGFDHIF